MLKKALGLIETEGLIAAIEAADAAVKSADVSLIGYELTQGGGLVTVKVTGEVSAVQAAISSASYAAARVGSVYSTRVIPRPAPGLEMMVFTAGTVEAGEETEASAGHAGPASCGQQQKTIEATRQENKEAEQLTSNAQAQLTTADETGAEEIPEPTVKTEKPKASAGKNAAARGRKKTHSG